MVISQKKQLDQHQSDHEFGFGKGFRNAHAHNQSPVTPIPSHCNQRRKLASHDQDGNRDSHNGKMGEGGGAMGRRSAARIVSVTRYQVLYREV